MNANNYVLRPAVTIKTNFRFGYFPFWLCVCVCGLNHYDFEPVSARKFFNETC